jgi:hypothetical protein
MLKTNRLGTSIRRALLVASLSLSLVATAAASPAAADATTGTGPPAIGPALEPERIPGVAGCQSSIFWLYLSNGGAVGWECSGYKPVNAYATQFFANGWSGVIGYNGRATWAFCDGESANLGRVYVNYVDLYASKAPWC